jgi:uncharacterized protein YjdB
MKKQLLTLKALILLLAACWSGNMNSQVVISQIYGGGGNSGSTYTHDFVELFNRGQEPVNVEGWSIQYASATGSGWGTTVVVLPDFTIQPGQYYLVQQAQGDGGTTPLPTPDFVPVTPIAMGGTNLKLVLANTNEAVTGTNPTNSNIVDLVGLGNANGFEGAVGPAMSNTTAAFRKENGCQDTNNNGNDFITGAPNPRNSSTALNVCPVIAVESVEVTTQGGVPAVIDTDNGTLQLIATVTPAEANQNVVWSIEAGEEFATISEGGLLTAVDNGTVTVRATSASDEEIYDEIDVTITNQVEDIAVVISVENDEAAEITTDGGTLQLMAAVTPASVSQEVVWSVVAGSEFASVDADGLVTALANGTVTIRATSVEDETAYDEIEVVITNQVIEVVSVTVTTQGGVAATITTNGGTLQLVATIAPAQANQEVEWSIVDGEDLATVSATGLVTALENGTVTVRATSVEDEDIYDEIEIVITGQVVEVASITVATQGGASTTLNTAGATVQLVATVLPAEANQNVVWTVQSGTGVVTVSNAGLVTAVANGTAVVRATSASNNTVFGEITIIVNIISSVNEVAGAELVVYPNPTAGLVFIATEGAADVTVYNAQGQLVLSSNNQRTIDMTGFENGIYTVKIDAGNDQSVVKRIVKF